MKNTKSLLITLGHNSSVIFVDGHFVIGYEQERLSGIKADSQFPKDAISEIIHNVGLARMKDCNILISHWFDCSEDCAEGEFIPSKYMTQTDYDNLKEISVNINFVDNSFTHHDAHAWSAMSFFNYFYSEDRERFSPMLTKQLYTIVADGFGTNQEVLSIYESHYMKDKTPKLIHRVYGYEASLGLMYQYATSFCGMKENQDEYKFLGYEAHITECFKEADIEKLKIEVKRITNYMLELAEKNTKPIYGKTGSIDTRQLTCVKRAWHDDFREVIEGISIEADEKFDYKFKQRVAIAFLIQGVVESYMLALVEQYSMHNIVCAGGCFYNVKLNNAILTNTDGLFSVMPLAGDQGAAIGLYHKYTNVQFPFRTLAIGKRRLYNIKKSLPDRASYHMMTKDNFRYIARELAHLISDGNIVNLIIGDMEFGPRALCNTSTLMLPTAENVANNNRMNNRNEVMPCAPVCTPNNAFELFDKEELSRVIGSDLFMICTHEYYKPYSQQYAGVMHRMPSGGYATGRPQIARPGTFMETVLEDVQRICDAKCLVNTSFNAHGRPIAFDTTQILQNFEYQCEHAREGKEPMLFIVEITE